MTDEGVAARQSRLSVRNGTRQISGPHEGLPPWLHGPVQRWVVAKFSTSSLLGMGSEGRRVAAHIALTHDIQTASFDDGEAVVTRVIDASDEDPELSLDVVDAILRLQPDGLMPRTEGTARLASVRSPDEVFRDCFPP